MTNLFTIPTRRWWLGIIPAVMLFACLGGLAIFPPVTRTLLALTILIVPSGILSAVLLHGGRQQPLWFVLTAGIAYGWFEWILVGRLLMLIHAPVIVLPIVLTGFVVVKVLFVWRSSAQFVITPDSHQGMRMALIIALGLLIILSVRAYVVNMAFPPYPFNAINVDKFTYLAVLQQFLVSPSEVNLRSDVVIQGSNTRLGWNAWLYGLASLSNLTQIEAIPFIFQYVRPALLVIGTLGIYGLARQLFRHHAISLIALTLFMVMSFAVSRSWVFGRLEEDKFIMAFVLMPLVWLFVLRGLASLEGVYLIGIGAGACVIALIHPLSLPGLLATTVPFMATEWLRQRDRRTFIYSIVVILTISIFLVITLSDRALVYQNAFTIALIAETGGSLPYYGITVAPNLLPEPVRFIIFLLVPMAFFAISDRVAAFLFCVGAVCVAILSFPLLTALVSRLVTSVIIYRFLWFIPFGFIVAYLAMRLIEFVAARHPAWAAHWRNITWSGVLIGVVCWTHLNWWRDGDTTLFPMSNFSADVMSDDTVITMRMIAPIIGSDSVVLPSRYSDAAPTWLPEAALVVYLEYDPPSVVWQEVNKLYAATAMPDVEASVANLKVHYVLVTRGSVLHTTLTSDQPDGWLIVYESTTEILYRIP